MFELYLMIEKSVMHISEDSDDKSSFATERSGLPVFSVMTPEAYEREHRAQK